MIASSSSRCCTSTTGSTAGVLIRRRSEWRSRLWLRSNGTMIAVATVAPNKASNGRSGRQRWSDDRNLHSSAPWMDTEPFPCASFSRSSGSLAFLPIRPLFRVGQHNWGHSGRNKWFSSEPLQRDEETTPTTIVASEPVVRGQVVSEEDVQKAEVHRTRLSEVRRTFAHTHVNNVSF
jgi:hypothetical protein